MDDLDDGFRAHTTVGALRLRGVSSSTDRVETDRGLPVHRFGSQPGWARQSLPTAWGRYRRTAARIPAGTGTNRATFDAELPETGRWRLDFHVPNLRMVGLGSEVRSPYDEQGVYALEVTSGGTSTVVDFDAAAAREGWNEVEVLDLAVGEVRVAVSDKTSGRSVVADAIRWEHQR